MKFIFENGEDVIVDKVEKTINQNIEELKNIFPYMVDNKHVFEFLYLTKDGEEKGRS